MTIRLEEIGKFVLAKPGTGIGLPGERRRVRLELNTQGPCQIMFDYGDDDLRFLATVEGRETVEFIADGPVRLFPDCEGQVWWWTSELESSAIVSDAPTFTKIAEREARNIELERIVRKASENQERRMTAVLAQYSQVLDAQRDEIETLKAEKKNAKPAKRNTGAADSDGGSQSSQQSDPPGSKEAPTGDDGGTGDGEE